MDIIKLEWHVQNSTQTPVTARKTWSTPQLCKVGTISDVAGAETPMAQAVNVKS